MQRRLLFHFFSTSNFVNFLCEPCCFAGSYWSISVSLLRQLYEVLEHDIKVWIGEARPVGSNGQPVQWDGTSYAFTEYFKQNKIDPKSHSRYSKYYVNQRQTIAGSYVWADRKLTEFADEPEKPIHSGKYCWIDVLINRQFEINSDNVVALTGDSFSRHCDVLLLLSDTIFHRGWCLFEAANYTTKGYTSSLQGNARFCRARTILRP